ncbi:MAG: DUF4197 domain-containing protein [Bacteroidetes bacterium]|nr:MAG: DUF4197 domain-containing protein [Bacteroidota bacterium]
MNWKKNTILALTIALALPAFCQIRVALGKLKQQAEEVIGSDSALSQEEVGAGLKEALNLGVEQAVSFLAAENGYLNSPYKIRVPEEAQNVVSKLKNVPGFGDVEQQLEEKMNRAAELAVEKAKPIFVDAIKGLTFQDAMSLLMGEPDAATRYLERTTTQSLVAEFLPIIQQSLDEVNASEYWRSAVTAYNRIPFVQKTNPELDQHVTTKALEGLFKLVEVKEREIRNNPALRSSELLRKVFAKQD